jgi:integrase
VKRSTANASLAVLKQMLWKAEEWGYLAEGANPARKLKIERVRNTRERCLDRDEKDALLAACPAWLRLVVMTAAHTGGLRGEVLSLTWQDVDFNARTICYRDTKNGDARKAIMSGVLCAALRGSDSRQKHGPVFIRGDRPVDKNMLRSGFEASVRKAGLGPHVTFHTLRHTWATDLAMDGVPLRTLQALGGWRRLEMVQRYAAVTPASKKLAAEALDRISAPPPPHPHHRGPRTLQGLLEG